MARELPKVYGAAAGGIRNLRHVAAGRLLPRRAGPEKKPFTIVMPPTQRNGPAAHGSRHGLHLAGHPDPLQADAGLRHPVGSRHRPRGHRHPDQGGGGAARKEGLTRYDLGREKFLERVWDWKDKYGDRIVEQQKKLGASCDWEPRPLHHGRGLLQGRAGGLRLACTKRA